MIELDPTFVDISVERWQRLTGGTARRADIDQRFDRGGNSSDPTGSVSKAMHDAQG